MAHMTKSRRVTARSSRAVLASILMTFLTASAFAADSKPQFSGVYPHLAWFNSDGECGTGAVVPWADGLWVITYSPHKPHGSDDKLYEIDADMNITTRPESVGGTPANRMIHRESQQLLIGPYLIDRDRNVRVITPEQMPGRLTGNARHLTDPANKVYYATMEEGFYEVDVRTLDVKLLYGDTNRSPVEKPANLPGYHGKGCYSGQGVLVYANNGEYGQLARTRPDIPSGCLAQWDGRDWTVVLRNQFTEVTGPGGIYGNPNPKTDPLWAVGWDHRSLILMLLDGGKWHRFRLPKAAHTYDGAHGWNTEWPRIREIGEKDLLMTMHGMFWQFPKTFSRADTSGLQPRSTYLCVIGDFCRWDDRLVLGCDVTARSEFLNKRKAKGDIAAPGQSQSNARFIKPGEIDHFGPPLGRGAVWLNDKVAAGKTSDPFMFAGFERRGVHLAHDGGRAVKFTFEVDPKGNGQWKNLRTVTVGPDGYEWIEFAQTDVGQWLRVSLDRSCDSATAYFQYSDSDNRQLTADPIFAGLATPDCKDGSGGIIRVRGAGMKTLHFAATNPSDSGGSDIGYYEIDADMKLKRVDDPTAYKWLKDNVAVPRDVLTVDAASVLYIDDSGKRFRLPRGDSAFDNDGPFGSERVDREVCTERDLFNCHGTFYELPAENAGGFAKIRPVATHNRRIKDYCSWRGLLVMAGIAADAPADNDHIIRSDDGKCALWVGAVDDLWKLGKAVGRGGPWKDTPVKAGEPSDPYLMTGYDEKTLTLSHESDETVTFTVQVDIDGNGSWKVFKSFEVMPDRMFTYHFSDAFAAYWVRVIASQDTTATAQLLYE